MATGPRPKHVQQGRQERGGECQADHLAPHDARADVVGIFPNDASALRLSGAMLIEQNDEWLVCRRYLSDESMRLILNDVTDPDISLPNNNDQEEPAALTA